MNYDELTTADLNYLYAVAARQEVAFEYLERRIRARRAPLWVRVLRFLGVTVVEVNR